ncbi:MAG: 1,4-dihydroxy-2-naphthoate octaprenyltransferase [Crocinitomicaceae bacterium]|nr:1,4-dihydroxy-2-naphthoate octaprenyltransferase [Crocinitomicaceae bacterium]|tara:strand:+ start:2664 stop:3569 length:906 start_codon:yes stop_codon:yes gene_type:complete
MAAPTVKAWITAFRLRTLPLALSSVLLGSFLAAQYGIFKWPVAILAVTTTLFLQILSNLANDYGDGVKGTDNEERIGPQRAIQSGEITTQAMKRMIVVFVILSLASGIGLILVSFSDDMFTSLVFLLLGMLSIAAAIKYTMGKGAYGYHGLGDLFVFLFFGLTGVVGTFYLHTHVMEWEIFLAASAVGFLSAGVLNLNNMRDRISDKNSGKNTLVVKIGGEAAKMYHAFLIIGAVICTALFILLEDIGAWAWIFLLTVPLFAKNLITVFKNKEPRLLDPLLKQLAISTLLFVLLLGVGSLL